MRFEQLYSSSKGNLYVVISSSGKRLLLECGVGYDKILKALNYDLSNIEACFVTHDHKDHCRAINDICKAGIDTYSAQVTFDQCCAVPSRRQKVVANETLVRLDSFEVFAFDVHHDAAEPLGFIVRCDNEFLLFATDTSHISQRFSYQFSIVALECSYSKAILENRVATQDINETLAKRLLLSHTEKQVCMDYLDKFVDLSKCHEIHLLHLSGDNIDKKQTVKEFEEHFMRKVVIV